MKFSLKYLVSFILLSMLTINLSYAKNIKFKDNVKFTDKTKSLEMEILKKKEFISSIFDNISMKPIIFLPKGILNVLGIEIGRDSISGVLSKIGDAYLTKEYGESGSYILCYRSSTQKDNTMLLFEAGASGGWSTIDGFSLIQSDNMMLYNFVPSPYVHTDLRLPVGLKLGITQKELMAIMKMPSVIKGEWIGYIYRGKKRINEIDFDITVSVAVRIINSRVVEIWVSKTEFS